MSWSLLAEAALVRSNLRAALKSGVLLSCLLHECWLFAGLAQVQHYLLQVSAILMAL